MALRWVPEWVRKTIHLEGRTLDVCHDRSTGLISCPLCTPINELCPSADKPLVGVVPKKATYFFTVEDLGHHLREHQKGRSGWDRKIRYEEEEELEEQEEFE